MNENTNNNDVLEEAQEAVAEEAAETEEVTEAEAAETEAVAEETTEAETSAEIKRVYDASDYVEDPHTAVASAVYQKYVERTGDHTPTVIASTASPYKFPRVAVEAVSGKAPADDFAAVKELEKLSGVVIPKAVDGLETAEVRHKTVVATSDMQKAVEDYLGL